MRLEPAREPCQSSAFPALVLEVDWRGFCVFAGGIDARIGRRIISCHSSKYFNKEGRRKEKRKKKKEGAEMAQYKVLTAKSPKTKKIKPYVVKLSVS